MSGARVEHPAVFVGIFDPGRTHEAILLLKLLQHVVRASHRLRVEWGVGELVHQPAHISVADGCREEQVQILAALGRLSPGGIDLAEREAGVADAVVALQRMDLHQMERHIERRFEQIHIRVDPSVAARFQACIQPLVSPLRLRGTVDALVVQQELPVGVERRGHRARAGHACVEIVVVPRRVGSVDVGIGHLHAVHVLDALRVVIVQFDCLGRLDRVAAHPGAAPFAVGCALHVVGRPVGVGRRDVGVVGVNALQPAERKLRGNVPLQPRLAALLRRGMQLQGEALALVAPGDLVAVLHDVIQSIGANRFRARMVPLEGFDIAGHGPHHRLALILTERWRIGDCGQRLFVERRRRDENALVHRVALPVSLRNVLQSAIDGRAVTGGLRLFLGVGSGGVGPVPVVPDGREDGLRGGAGHQYARVGVAIGDVGHRDEFRRSDAGNAPERQLHGIGTLAARVEHQRLLPQSQLVFDEPGAILERRFHNVSVERDRGQSALRDRAFSRIFEAHAAAVQRPVRLAAIDACGDLRETAGCGVVFVDDCGVMARVAQFKRLRPGLAHARLEVLFEIHRQDRLFARRKRQRAGTGVESYDLAAPGLQVALRLLGELDRGQFLAIERERVAEEVARLGVADLRDLQPRERRGQRDALQHCDVEAAVDQPPLLPVDIDQRNARLFAMRVGDQHRDAHGWCRLVVLPSPAVAVAPQIDGVEVAGDGDRLGRASHDAALFRRAGEDELPDVMAPHLLLAAAAEFTGRAVLQLQGPALQIFEIDERVRVLRALRPTHLIRLLSHLLPGFDVVDGRDHLDGVGREGERKRSQTQKEAKHGKAPIMSGLSHREEGWQA